MKNLWILLPALCAVFLSGCKSDAGDKTASNAPATTSATDAPAATDSAKPADSTAPAAESTALVGKWAKKTGEMLDLTADGALTMTDGKGTTFTGTYKEGGDSKTLTGGKEIKLTFTGVKADDPSKQADVEKNKDAFFKFANSQPAASVKVDADGTMEWQDAGSTKTDKLTKK